MNLTPEAKILSKGLKYFGDCLVRAVLVYKGYSLGETERNRVLGLSTPAPSPKEVV